MFTYFDAYGGYQYIRIETFDKLRVEPTAYPGSRSLQDSQSIEMADIDELFVVRTQLACPYHWKTVSLGPSSTAPTSIVLQIDYQ